MAPPKTSLIIAGFGVVGMGLGTLFHIIGMATPAWTVKTHAKISESVNGRATSVSGGVDLYGPWTVCVESVGLHAYGQVTESSGCKSVSGKDIKWYVDGDVSTGDAWEAVRTCTLLGVFAAIGAIIFTVVAAVMNGTSKANIAKILSILVIVAAGVAFLCIVIGVFKWSTGVGNVTSSHGLGESKWKLGYSAVLTIIGGLLIGGGGLIAGIGGMFGKKK